LAIRIFNFFLFTSLFITLCALLMVHQANQLLNLHYDRTGYYWFVFFSTLCSYNFHWYLTPDTESENARVRWTQQHKTLHLILTAIGLAGAGWYFFHFIQHWFWLSGAGLLTFLYSAPKLPHRPFAWLRKIAIGKTLFLTFVWTYVTTFLPVAMDGHHWNTAAFLFFCSRFFLIYAICILFDYRDRDYDRQAGIRSMITYFSEKGINMLFYTSLLLFTFSTCALYGFGFTWPAIILLLIPGGILLYLYPVAKKNFSDYLYYFVLDGLMMLSALFTVFASNP
jgi:4-hydroxybenzoate polyprenyltransferase